MSNFEQLGHSARVIVCANKRSKRRTLHDHVSHLGSSIRRGPRWVHLGWNRLRTNAVITGAKFITDDRLTVGATILAEGENESLVSNRKGERCGSPEV